MKRERAVGSVHMAAFLCCTFTVIIATISTLFSSVFTLSIQSIRAHVKSYMRCL